MSADRAKGNSDFDQFAENYDRDLSKGLSLTGESREFFARARAELLAKRLDELKFSAVKIMDFGCGDGSSTPILLGLPGAKCVVGVDRSAESIRKAVNTHAGEGISFETDDDYMRKKQKGEFNLVFSNGVFHHIPPENRAGAVAKVFDALIPGGLFALWENNPWNPGTKWVMSRIPFDKEAKTLSAAESERLLQAEGFEIISTAFHFYFPRFLSFLRFLERPLSKLPLGAQYMVLGRKP